MKRRITLSPRTNSIIAGRWDMRILTFAYNQDTLNTEIEILDKGLDVKNATLKIYYLKSLFIYI